jgi:transposase-like protein
LEEDGVMAGLTSEERERLKLLERKDRELRRANEILKSASVSSTGERTHCWSRVALGGDRWPRWVGQG